MSETYFCTLCGQRFKPSIGHCSGKPWGGCCSSFDTERTADAHRIGEYDDGSRRCMTVEERHAKGWYQTEEGYWRSPKDDQRAQRARAYFEARNAR